METPYQKLKKVINGFCAVNNEAFGVLQGLFTQKRLVKGEFFVKAGAYVSEVAFLDTGVIRAFYRTHEGIEYNKTFFVENSFVAPLAALLTKEKSYLYLEALTSCNLLISNYNQIENLFKDYRQIETLIRRILEEEWVVKKELRELRLVLNSAKERYEFFKQEYPGLENIIPQYHIASHLGVTPTQLSRIRASYKNA